MLQLIITEKEPKMTTTEEENKFDELMNVHHGRNFIGVMLTLPVIVGLLATAGAWMDHEWNTVIKYGLISAGMIIMLIVSCLKKGLCPFWLCILMAVAEAHCFYDLKLNEIGNRISMIFMGAYAIAALPASILSWLTYVKAKVEDGAQMSLKGLWNTPIAFIVVFLAVIAGGYKYLNLAAQ